MAFTAVCESLLPSLSAFPNHLREHTGLGLEVDENGHALKGHQSMARSTDHARDSMEGVLQSWVKSSMTHCMRRS